MKKVGLIESAIDLRNKNCSLKDIADHLNVSKSTASIWLRNTLKKKRKLTENGRLRIKNGFRFKGYRKPIHELKSQTSVRKRVFKERGKVCEDCGWNEENPYYKFIPVQVHHKDGDKKNNRSENLTILCPNCHSLTKFFGFAGRSRFK